MRRSPLITTDGLYRQAYRFGFPLARLWWCIRLPSHQGALVAIHVGASLLLLRSSYRSAWNFPGGGVRPGETPEAAARRELREELGLTAPTALQPAGEASGFWDCRRDHVFFFTLHFERLPPLRLDNREIVGARLAPIEDLRAMRLTGPVQAYLSALSSAARMPGARRRG